MADEPGPNGAAESSRREDLFLELKSVRELYGGLAPSLGTDGVFIAIEEPAEAGSKVAFQVTLPGGALVLDGTGIVAWTRSAADDRGPAGMAVRFSELSTSARETVDAVIDAHLAAGGALFDLEAGPGGADVFPTDALEGIPQPLGQHRWRWRSAAPESPRGGSADRGRELFRTEREADAIDLRFEEILHGLSPTRESDDAGRPPELDEAIAKAVGAPAAPTEPGPSAPGEGADEVPTIELEGPGAGDDEIPEILDHWRKEVDTGVHDLATLAGPLRRSGPNGGAEPGPGRLPFGEGGGDELATRPVPPGDLSSGREQVTDEARPWLWWVVGAAAVALLAATLVLLWPGGGPPSSRQSAPEAAPSPAAPPRRAAEPTLPAPEPASTTVVGESRPDPGSGRLVQAITARSGAGSTEVVVRANRSIDPDAVDTLQLEDPPRILIRVRGIDQPYTPHRIEVSSPEVSSIRIGHHPEIQPPTLYVVLDTTSSLVGVVNSAVDGPRATVVVARSGR